jgi:hypothetical protein
MMEKSIKEKLNDIRVDIDRLNSLSVDSIWEYCKYDAAIETIVTEVIDRESKIGQELVLMIDKCGYDVTQNIANTDFLSELKGFIANYFLDDAGFFLVKRESLWKISFEDLVYHQVGTAENMLNAAIENVKVNQNRIGKSIEIQKRMGGI